MTEHLSDEAVEAMARAYEESLLGPFAAKIELNRNNALERRCEAMRAALAALPPAALSASPDGWVLVPREPGACELDDSGWLLAFMVALHSRVAGTHPIMGWADFDDEQRARIANAYRASIAAAPKPPEPSR